MPTLDDLRSVLIERESFAGDVNSVRAAVDAPRRRSVHPILAGAALVVAAAGVAVLATGHNSRGEQSGQTQVSASSTPFSGTPAPATTAPPTQDTALRWSFSVGRLPGSRVDYTGYNPYRQVAEVSDRNGSTTVITVYSKGAYQVGAGGEPVDLNGKTGYWTYNAYLVWEYAPDSWATVGSGGSPHSNPLRHAALRVAQAVRFRTGTDVVTALALRDHASRFLVEAVTNTGDRSCIGYGTGDAYPAGLSNSGDVGTVLTACRVNDAATVIQHNFSGDRTYTKDLGDGTSLVLAVNAAHLDEVSAHDLIGLAAGADTSPDLSDPATWLPVG